MKLGAVADADDLSDQGIVWVVHFFRISEREESNGGEPSEEGKCGGGEGVFQVVHRVFVLGEILELGGDLISG